MTQKIKISEPNIGDEEIEAVARVLRTGNLVHGQESVQFEKELAEFLRCKEAVLVSSGTAALHLSLVALGVGPGDAVLVPNFTFTATANAVELVGARPIFVDVSSQDYCMNGSTMRAAIDTWSGPEKIKAVIPVHQFGAPVEMDAVIKIANEYQLEIIEDAACALGAEYNGQKVGTLGRTGCFSFHPRKTLTTGEGGVICTNDETTAEKIRVLRNHGISSENQKIDFILPGFNYRLTNFQAAMGRVQLPKLLGWIEERKKLVSFYCELLKNLPDVIVPRASAGHSWQTFMVTLSDRVDRDQISKYLEEHAVESSRGAWCIHSLEYYRKKYPEKISMPISESLSQKGLALPLSEVVDEGKIKKVVVLLEQAIEKI